MSRFISSVPVRCWYSILIPTVIAVVLSACSSGSSNGNNPVNSSIDNSSQPNNQPNDATASNTTLSGTSCAESLGSGTLGASFTLTNTDSACDYYLQGEIVLNGELTIEAGTTVVAGIDSQIRINGGALIAIGTESAPITFQGEVNAKGFWKGISLTDARPSRIEYVVVRDAGQVQESRFEPHAAIDVNDSTLSLANVVVSNSFVHGVGLVNGTVLTDFSSNTFFGNSLAGLTISPDLVAQLDADTDYIGETSPNGNPVVQIHDEDISQKPIDNATWKALNALYEILTQLGLTEPREQLTLEAGVEIITREDIYAPVYIFNGGRLIAIGTSDNPVTFTAGTSDIDTHSIDIRTGGEAVFDHAIISGYDNGVVVRGGTVSISNTALNVAQGFGVSCGNASARDNVLTIGDGVTVSDNAEALLGPNC